MVRIFYLVVCFVLFKKILTECLVYTSVCQGYDNRVAYSKEDKGVLSEIRCSCDTICKFFNDCCEDALANKAKLPDSFSELSLDLFSCVLFPEVSSVNFLYYVARCPSSWPDGVVKQACEKNLSDFDDFILRVPVTGHKTGMMYKNMYCAMCHGSSYLFWVPVVRCKNDNVILTENTTLHNIYLKAGCFLRFDKPAANVDYRHCLTPNPIVDTCSESYNNTEIKEKCKQNKGLKLTFDKKNSTLAYRNPYCFMCNSRIYSICNMLNTFSIVDLYAFYPFIMIADINKVTVTVTFGTKYARRTLNITNIPSCLNDQVFDPFTMVCVTINCDARMSIKDGLCYAYKNTSDQSCHHIQLNQNEYMILDNGNLLELSSGFHYAKSLYYIKHSSAFVCSNVSQNHTEKTLILKQIVFRFSPAEVYITVAGLLISLLALFITVLTYSAIRPLQNTIGKCILSLSCSLFIADLLMLVGPNAEDIMTACKGIGICMHYCFLAAFFWMNTMAINALITVFDIRKKTTTVKLLNRFSVYSIYSWTGPALIVVPSILVDMFLVDSTFKPNYGMGLCWLTNTNALMMFFAGPLFIIILMNAIFFVIIATKISQGGDSNRHSDVKDKTNVFICMKLFLVIGLTWSVGFVANLIPHPVFWYLFIFLNTLQGLFIFLSFVATKQVWRLVRDRLVAVDGNSESSPSVVASSLTELPSHKASGIVAGKYDDMPVSKSQI